MDHDFAHIPVVVTNAEDARLIQRGRLRLLKAAFDRILKTVLRKIELSCKENLSVMSLRTIIPPTVMGYPLYRREDARRYVKKKLERLGFIVTWPYNSQNIIIVSWAKKDI